MNFLLRIHCVYCIISDNGMHCNRYHNIMKCTHEIPLLDAWSTHHHSYYAWDWFTFKLLQNTIIYFNSNSRIITIYAHSLLWIHYIVLWSDSVYTYNQCSSWTCMPLIRTYMQVGACVVNPDYKIVGIGHNALPESRGCAQRDFPHWEKRDIEKDGFENTKYAHGKGKITSIAYRDIYITFVQSFRLSNKYHLANHAFAIIQSAMLQSMLSWTRMLKTWRNVCSTPPSFLVMKMQRSSYKLE